MAVTSVKPVVLDAHKLFGQLWTLYDSDRQASDRLWYDLITRFVKKPNVNLPFNKVEAIMLSKKTDAQILQDLKALVPPKKVLTVQDNGREASRVADIAGPLENIKAVEGEGLNYIDIGSSEGKITSAVVDFLQLPPNRVYAVDIIAQEPSPKFQFLKLNEPGIVSNGKEFNDSQFSLQTMFMSGHHFEDEKMMFSDAYRIMAPNGYLIMREHDVAINDVAFRLFLDLIHAFYGVVLGNEETPEAFSRNYSAKGLAYYRSRQEWTHIAGNAGFKLIKYIDPPRKDMFQSYYAIYQKPNA